jgi:TPR repeat protein
VGKGVKQDYAKAVHHYTIAAEKGDASAAYYLGECYQNGNGCKQDIEKAKYWYKKGAEGGSKYAIEALSSLE